MKVKGNMVWQWFKSLLSYKEKEEKCGESIPIGGQGGALTSSVVRPAEIPGAVCSTLFPKESEPLIVNNTEDFQYVFVDSGTGVCKDTAGPAGSAETGGTDMQGGSDYGFEIS